MPIHTRSGWTHLPPAIENSVGLALSGGGMRAALFHLGALRRLNELGILSSVDTISCVSGGSIFAGFLAKKIIENQGIPPPHLWQEKIAEPFYRFVARDFRTRLLVAKDRIKAWQRMLEAHCCGETKLCDLLDKPNILFCATDLVNHSFIFSKQRVGSSYRGTIEQSAYHKVSEAVAASSCFPLLFRPFKIDHLSQKGLKLIDGGVRDNMGTDEIMDHETILVSDAGAPFTVGGSRFLLRKALDISQDQSTYLRQRWLCDLISSGRRKGSLWSIGPRSETPGFTRLGGNWSLIPDRRSYPYAVVMQKISLIRTDLNHFTDAECQILENHGYGSVEFCLQQDQNHLPAAFQNRTAQFKIPHRDWIWDVTREPTKEEVEAVHHRISGALARSHARISWRNRKDHLRSWWKNRKGKPEH